MKNRFTPWCDGSWPWTALLVRAPLTPPRCSSWSRRPAPWCPRQPPAGWPASFCPCGCSGSANGPSRPADLEKTRRRGKGRGAGGGERYYTDRGGFTGLKFHSTHNRNLLWSGQFFFSFLSLYIKNFFKKFRTWYCSTLRLSESYSCWYSFFENIWTWPFFNTDIYFPYSQELTNLSYPITLHHYSNTAFSISSSSHIYNDRF